MQELNMVFEILLGILVFFGYLYWRFQQKTQLWQTQGVPVAKDNIVFPIGNSALLNLDLITGKASTGDIVIRQYNAMKDEPFFGGYGPMGGPVFVPRDLDLVKAIMVKDSSTFINRNGVIQFHTKSNTDLYWANQIIFLDGEDWKSARSAMTPAFTTGKIKLMKHLLQLVCKDLNTALEKIATEKKTLNMSSFMGLFSMDAIASCAFGVNAHSFTDANSQFAKNASGMFRRGLKDNLLFAMYNTPGLKQLLDILQIPIAKPAETLFLSKVVKETIKQRRASEEKDLMLECLQDDTDTKKVDKNMVIANAILFLVAGYDTTAITLSYCIYEMSRNPRIQERLQEEIDNVCEEADGKMPDYEVIQDMPYLEKVIQEALRLYSPAPVVMRCSTEDYQLPHTNIRLKKGTEVHIPIMGIHRDPVHYDTPDDFNPEHFSVEAKAKRHPYAFLGFGHGPRQCLGIRFAYLGAKMALITILGKYNVLKCPSTPEKITFNPNAIFSACLKPLDVQFKKRINPTLAL